MKELGEVYGEEDEKQGQPHAEHEAYLSHCMSAWPQGDWRGRSTYLPTFLLLPCRLE